MASFLTRCKFNPTAGGTTDWTVSSAVTGFLTPVGSGAVDGKTYRYVAESADLSQWEVGYGVCASTGTVIPRTTVLYNSSGTTSKINFASAPQVTITVLAEDTGPLTLAGATINANPSNPTGTTSGTPLMMGLGGTCTLTPSYSSRVRFQWSGLYSNSTGGAGNGLRFYYGTGAAPSNGAATTGTQIGSTMGVTCATAGGSTPFPMSIIVTGLTPGTAYWFDIALNAGSGTASISALNFEAMEV